MSRESHTLLADSDKQTEMADDFLKALSKAAGIPKTLVFLLFLSEHADVFWPLWRLYSFAFYF